MFMCMLRDYPDNILSNFDDQNIPSVNVAYEQSSSLVFLYY